jgi:hypothetical protein
VAVVLLMMMITMIPCSLVDQWGSRWRSWLRHCPTSRKFADSIPDGVIAIFDWFNPSGLTMAQRSLQSLT